MNNKKYNIEEVFKSELEDFEMEVPQNAWGNISQKIPSATSTTTTGSILGGQTLLIAASSILVVATIAFISIAQLPKEANPPQETQTQKNENTATPHSNTTKKAEKHIASIPTSATEKKDPVIEKHFAEEELKEKDKKYIIQPNIPPTIEQQVEAPKGKPALNSPIPEKELVTPPAPPVNNIEIIEVETTQLIANISASPIGGPAPLVVEFTHDCENATTNWEFENGNTSSQPTTTYTFEKAGQYEVTLTVKDKNGNTTKDTKVITVSPTSSITNIPNIFTPNNDNINDYFTVQHEHIATFNLYIYNKQGVLIFETQDITTGWDGYNNYNEESPAQDYIYIIRATGIDGKQFEEKGIIKLAR
ncbi:MAG: gliding motility-associated C-terminal domain-containing protein [Flavobacteriales bacterium]|jgi:gliding motility-associated-like protein|nr:gliding motility-associated C-terminal domain-containing protein [Flavobacteriales bacterium]